MAAKKTKKKPLKKSDSFVPSQIILLKQTAKLIKNNWKQILAVTAIYGALYLIFVRTLANLDIQDVQTLVNDYFGQSSSSLANNAILTGTIFGLSADLDQSAGLYAAGLFIINSLALIWILRHIYAKKKTTVKEAYYEGMYPLIPLILILLIMTIQIIPFSIGSFIMASAFSNGLAVTLIEKLVVISIFILSLVITGWLLTNSLLGVYIVTIPEMTPIKALKSGKELLKGRRFIVLQRIIVAALIMLGLSFTILLLSVWLISQAALLVAAVLSVLFLPLFHSYMYTLYRNLLDD